MKILAYLTTMLLLCLFCVEAKGQDTILLTGTVTDESGNPLEQVVVRVEHTSSGTYTDSRGHYTLTLAKGEHTLVVSCLGYRTVKRKLNLVRSVRCDFTMQEVSRRLRSVEVYGKTKSQQMREGSLAVNVLDVRPLASSLNDLTGLVGRTSGIKVRQEGGVGSDYDLSINGMSGNSVRYFIDGVPLETRGNGITLANLPINLVDRIEIYKGVVPASLGADALGGAINIVTQ